MGQKIIITANNNAIIINGETKKSKSISYLKLVYLIINYHTIASFLKFTFPNIIN